MSGKKHNVLVHTALLLVLTLVVSLAAGCGLAEDPTEIPAEELTMAPPETPAPETGDEEEDSSEPVVLVTVNGEPIDSYDEYLNSVISYYLDYASYYGYDVTSQDMIDTVNQYSLLYTIRTVVLNQKAKELGLDGITDEEKAEMEAQAKADWQDILVNYATSSGTITETSSEDDKAAAIADAAAEIKASDNYDEERYVKESVKNSIENLIEDRVKDYLTEGKTVSEEDILNYFNDLVSDDEENYKDNIAMYEYYTQYYGQSSYYTPEGYRAVNHILLTVDEELLNNWKDLNARMEEQKGADEAESTDEEPEDADEAEEDEETPAPEEPAETPPPAEPTEEPTPTPEPVTQEMIDAAEKAILDSVQPTVDEINAKLAAGASFDDLIREYGTDPGMQDDATRAKGYYVHQDSILWDPAFTRAAMSLENVGDVSEPVIGQYGVHILHYLQDVPSGAVELTDEMRDEFSATLLDEMREDALSDALDQWTAESEITYTEAGESWKVVEEEEEAEEEAEESADESIGDEEPAGEEPAE